MAREKVINLLIIRPQDHLTLAQGRGGAEFQIPRPRDSAPHFLPTADDASSVVKELVPCPPWGEQTGGWQ